MKTAEIIEDSLHPNGQARLTTMRLRIPTAVLPQFNTHRMFSRNAASMRAIPTPRIVADVVKDPYIPEFLANKPGMQGGDPVKHQRLARGLWKAAMHVSIGFVKVFAKLGLHKQVVNRLLSPWSYSVVLVTGTDAAWANFFHLRAHPDADPGIKVVADAALVVMRESTPRQLSYGEWHCPLAPNANLIQSVARCARVSNISLTNPGKESTFGEDLKLYQKLVGSQPLHASPAEHQATPASNSQEDQAVAGNFGGFWTQYRKTLPGEAMLDLNVFIAGNVGAKR